MKEKQTILIADDSAMNRAILSEMLGDGYTVIEAENGRQAVEVMQHNADIDLLMLDIMMPEMDGFGVLAMMNKYHWIDEIPVVMISAENASSYVERAYDLGATDYISRPFDMAIVRRRVLNTLMLYAKQKRLIHLVADQVHEKEKSNRLMINILSHIVEFRNGESGLHVLHIHTITELLLRRLVQKTDRYKLTAADISMISTASALHDIGKINIPEEILNKPGRLTKEEFEVIKTHTTIGADILKALPFYQDDPLVKVAYGICRWHHERYDGKGYPDGLAGEDIPISAQVVAMADVYDALTSERCYKRAFDHETAMRMILHGECGTFNPLLLDCLVEVGTQLSEQITANTAAGDFEDDTPHIPDALLNDDTLAHQDHVFHILEMEQAKSRFFHDQAQSVQFDYNALTGTLVLSDWAAAHTRGKKVAHLPEDGLSFLAKEDAKKLWELIRATTPEEPNVSMTVMFAVDGEYRWHNIRARSIWEPGEQPEFIGAVGQAIDIHDNLIKNASAPEGGIFTTAEGMRHLMQSLRHVFTVVRLIDVERMEILAVEPNSLLKPPDCPCFSVINKDARCKDCLSTRAYAGKTQLSKIELTASDAYQVIAKYVEVDGKGCVLELVNRMQDEMLANAFGDGGLMEKLREYSRALYRDALTGVYNRYYYEEQMNQLESAEAVAMIDADGFKGINDRYGHQTGDEALRTIARTILGRIRSSDILIRYGGDEFLLLFPKISREVFSKRLADICRAVESASVTRCPELRLRISVGGIYGRHPLAEAIHAADQLMYEAKSKGIRVAVSENQAPKPED